MKNMKQKQSYNHYVVMFFIMILSGLLSTMNIWVDKYQDIRFSINDAYMTLIMSGWMLFFMGLFYRDPSVVFFASLLIIAIIWCIRTQFLVTEEQYMKGMIPHHSMAIHMSKKLLEKEKEKEKELNIQSFVKNIIKTQQDEIVYMTENTK